MSHSWGAVRFPDGALYYFDYNGSVDLCVPVLVASIEDVHFRNMGWRNCACPMPHHQPVEIYSDYGGGSYWPGTACRYCFTLIGPLTPSGEYEDDDFWRSKGFGQPAWIKVQSLGA